MRLSNIVSAEPIAMCMSRYLYVPSRPPNSTFALAVSLRASSR